MRVAKYLAAARSPSRIEGWIKADGTIVIHSLLLESSETLSFTSIEG